jgi:hypothetical protein
MSRIRSIHPGLWTDETFVSLSAYARLLFMGVWNECDDKGCFPWSPLQMKMRVLPADNVDAAELMGELEQAGCVRSYEVNGKKFGAVRNFAKFQRPKKPNDIHPAPASILAYAGHDTDVECEEEPSVPNQFSTPSEIPPQMEEIKKEEGENPPTPRKRGKSEKTVLPQDWKLPAVADLSPKAKACAEQWTAGSYETHGEAFLNYWRSERRMKSDWDMAWANRVVDIHDRVMRAQKFGNAPPEIGHGKPAEPGHAAASLETSAATYRRIGRDYEAEQMEAEAKRLRATGPPRSIGQVLKVASA